MVYCLPATQCCCGCSTSFGVKSILVLHFLLNLRILGTAFGVVFSPTSQIVDQEAMMIQLFYTAYALAGLPLILMALWGTIQKVETLVRVYFWYCALSIFIDMAYFVNDLLLSGPCQNLPSMLQAQGQAFACGFARVANASVVLILLGMQCYLLHVVWSHCEDLAEAGGLEIADLCRDVLGRPLTAEALRELVRRENMSHQWRGGDAEDAYASFTPGNHGSSLCCWCINCDAIASEMVCCHGLFAQLGFGFSDSALESSALYTEAATSGLGKSSKIFHNGFHQMQYPPPPKHL